MCSTSMVGDYYKQNTFPQSFPQWGGSVPTKFVSQEEFDELKKSIEEIKILLLAAKKYDEAMNEPDCEMDEKVAMIKKLAEMVGVDLKEVFG